MGIAVHDVIYSLQSLPDGPGKYHAIGRTEIGGGVAANAAVAVSRLGGQSRYIGPVGDDSLGDRIVRDLKSEGVDTDNVRLVPGVNSPLSAIAVAAGGERIIINHSDDRLFEEAGSMTGSDLAGSDAVLADVRWVEGAAVTLQWAKEQGIPGVLDYDVGNRPSASLLPLASHVVLSADALQQLTGTSDITDGLQSIRKETSGWLGVTNGEEGTYWIEDDALRRQPTFEVAVVDTTGAGDVYHGALALALSRGVDDMSEAIEFASAAAALTCTTFGGRNGIPTGDEVRTFLAKRKRAG